MSESERTLWAVFRELGDKLSSDKEFAATFDADPSKALTESNCDVTVPATSESNEVQLSELLQRMTPIERRATIDAILESGPARPDRIAVVTPIANANALVNANAVENANAVSQANALANVNANANANTNSNGSGTRGINIDRGVLNVDLQGLRGTDLGRRFESMQLSEARQAALIKSALSESASVAPVGRVDGGEKVRAVSAFRGLAFEVEATVKGGQVTIESTRVLS